MGNTETGEKVGSSLLTAPENPNISSSPAQKLFEASATGDPALLELMLEDIDVSSLDMAERDHQHQTVLHRIMRKPLSGYQGDFPSQHERPNYEKCLDLILDYKQFTRSTLINMQDIHGNTALYYAT